MKTIVSQLDRAFRQAIRSAFDLEADPAIGVAQNDRFGDYQANAAMGLAKVIADKTGQASTGSPPAKTSPRAVAEQIKSKLDLGDLASEVTIAGPGFINVRLSPKWMAASLSEIAGSNTLGIEPVQPADTVVVDYSGPNIAKELHVGHLRSTIIGDAISRIIDFQGHHVVRQNHLGDWGTQFGMLIANLQDKMASSTASAPTDGADTPKLKDLEAFYVEAKRRFDDDVAFQARARENVVKLQAGESSILSLWRTLVDKTRDDYLPLYGRLGVKLTPEDERGESFYNPHLAGIVGALRDKGLAADSEGAVVVFVDGYENPLIIQKTGGGYLYGTTDLAAIRFRAEVLHAKRVIYFVDARQSQHFAQVFATAKKAGWAEGVSLEHAAFGTMLGPDGKPFKSRTGGTIKLKDLIEEAEDRAFKLVTEKNPDLPEATRREIAHAVGIGAMKYADLSKDRASDYVFSFDAMLALDGNTAPYLQYAHARVRSIFREAAKRGISLANLTAASIHLNAPHEIALARQILRFGEIIDLVGRELKPHHLCTYLYDLAGRFSGFYENCPVLPSEDPVRTSRLALADLTARTIACGLNLLGIEHPEQM